MAPKNRRLHPSTELWVYRILCQDQISNCGEGELWPNTEWVPDNSVSVCDGSTRREAAQLLHRQSLAGRKLPGNLSFGAACQTVLSREEICADGGAVRSLFPVQISDVTYSGRRILPRGILGRGRYEISHWYEHMGFFA